MKKLFNLFAILLASLCVLAGCEKPHTHEFVDGQCGCGEKDPNYVEPVKLDTIDNVIATYKNNDELIVQGVVYATEGGLYIADSQTGNIKVRVPETDKTEYKIGDKVEVHGEYGKTSTSKNVKNVKSITVLESGVACPHTATATTIKEIRTGSAFDLVCDLVTIIGTIVSETEGQYTIKDEYGNFFSFDENSNVEALQTKVNQRVTVKVVLSSYNASGNSWVVLYNGTEEELVPTALTIEEIKGYVAEDLVVPTEAWGALVLSSEHAVISSIKYEWSVSESDLISIVDNKATIVLSETEAQVTLTCKVICGELSYETTHPLTLKAVTEMDLAELVNNAPEVDKRIVITKGVVVSHARMQTLTSSTAARSVFIKDLETNETIRVDFGTSKSYVSIEDEEYLSLEVGTVVTITGRYRTAEAASPRIDQVSKMVFAEEKIENPIDFESAIVLDTQEAYDEFFKDQDSIYSKLVKFVNPYVSYSVSAESKLIETSWVRVGGAVNTVNNSTYLGRNAAFLIAAGNENLGGSAWHTLPEIPFVNESETPVQIGVDIYAYIYSTSDSYITLIIPNEDCFIAVPEHEVEMAIMNSTPASGEEGQVIGLLKAHSATANGIVWSSSNPELINPETGLVGEASENTEVTLTATYNVNGVDYSKEYTVTVLKSLPVSVSQLLASAENESQVKVSGLVIGHGSDGNTKPERYSILVMDPETQELIQVNNLSDGSYGKYLDSTGAQIKVGDIVTVKGTYKVDTAAIGSGPAQTGRKNIEVSSITVTGSQEVTFNDEKVISVSSQAELAALVADGVKFGQIVKVTGTFYIRGSKASPTEWAGTNVLFAVKDQAPASKGDMEFESGAKKYIFAMKHDNLEPLYGENWVKEAFGYENILTSNDYIPVSGTMYMVITHHTGSYYQCTLVNYANCSATPVVVDAPAA